MRARQVSITVDGGSLTVAGRIDASGFQPGIIRLAARGDLNLLGTLDAHGAGLRRDSHGQIIDSPNRAQVSLTSSLGTLTLGPSASIDRAPAPRPPATTPRARHAGPERAPLGRRRHARRRRGRR